jgi:hypothetical protein
MGVDLSRVANKALEAALEDADNHRAKHSGLKTLAAGAALAVAARAAISKAPGLVHMPDLAALRDDPERVRDRLADAGWLDDDEDAEEPVDEAQEFDEPDAEDLDEEDEEDLDEDEDEDLDEDEDEPVDEEDEDFDDEDEPVDEEDEDFDDEDEEEPDEEPAPELELESEDDEDLHPEDRPPKPPRSKAKAR